MAKTTTAKQKRRPTQQDTTLRNLRVTRRDVAALSARVTWLEQALVSIGQQALVSIGQALRAHGR